MKSDKQIQNSTPCKPLFCVIIALLVILPAGFNSLYAKPMTSAHAEKAVKGWLKIAPRPLGSGLGKEIELVDTYTGDDGGPIYYVVYLQPSGFVIVPADDLVEPIVCFLSGGTYDPSPDNCLGALVSRDLPARVTDARKVQGLENLSERELVIRKASTRAQSKWAELRAYAYVPDEQVAKSSLSVVSDVRVAPLVKSKWGQDTVCGSSLCYNYYTPNHYVCGCVATAMAQIMRFHEYPIAGIGENAFTIYVDDDTQTAYTRGGDGSGGPYSWSQMVLVPNSVCSTLTLAQRQAIGALCFDAGVAVNMEYTYSGSGALSYKARAALISIFLYTNAVYGYSSTASIPETNLNNMINPNLDANHPVYLGISDTIEGGGHAIVCDGYGYNLSTLYHHLNMGWDGYDDAWYDLPDIDALVHPFNVVDECIYNIYTSGSGEIISGRVTDTSGNPIGGANVTAQKVGGSVYNTTTNSKGIYALAKIPSASTYNINVTKLGYLFVSKQVTIGTSLNNTITTGNKWGINFTGTPSGPVPPVAQSDSVSVQQGIPTTIYLYAEDDGLPAPPAALTYIIVSLPPYGILDDPASGRITYDDLPYALAAYGNEVVYTPNLCSVDSSSFDFKADDGGTPPDGGESNIATITIDVQPPGPTVIFEADFTGGLPSGWTIINGGTSNDTWMPANPADWTSEFGWSGIITSPFMVVDSDEAGSTVWMDEQLITPSVDCSSCQSVILKFTHQFRHYYDEYADVDIRIDGGTWQNIKRWRYVEASENVELDVSSYAAEQSDVQVRWHYYNANWCYWWAVDDVQICGVKPQQSMGDVDFDCDVDLPDYAILAAAWFSGPGDDNWNPDCDISEPPDSFIDALDLAILANNWLEGAK